ncbi:MAG TPA: acido-empty-quinoprotein group A, partial [Bryobacteraceae bacterium]|nr:acido-empty-quinoprotein group A [Bryobacteraceae bacterium]
VLFTGDNADNLLGLDASTGKTLWHVNAGGRLVSSPMTYEIDGKQYLLTAVQDLVMVWKLPGD